MSISYTIGIVMKYFVSTRQNSRNTGKPHRLQFLLVLKVKGSSLEGRDLRGLGEVAVRGCDESIAVIGECLTASGWCAIGVPQFPQKSLCTSYTEIRIHR